MRYKLIYQDEVLGAAWRQYFGSNKGVEILSGDICNLECDALVSPANSFGFMDGGLDQAISERFGWGLEKRLQDQISKRPLKELLVGEALLIETDDERIPWLISAPTMRVPMRLRQTINAYLAMKAILNIGQTQNENGSINIIAIPGLGTGVGALPATTAAYQMWTAYREFVLGEHCYPSDWREAQKLQFALNPLEMDF